MNSFPMIVACAEGQNPYGGTEFETRNCDNCGEISHITYSYCALCCLKEDLGLWKRPEKRGLIWP